MKICKACLKEKPSGEFNIDRSTKDKKSKICRDCNREKSKAWSKKNMISLEYLGDHGWRKIRDTVVKVHPQIMGKG